MITTVSLVTIHHLSRYRYRYFVPWDGTFSKGENERYIHLNAEFQRTARKDKKAFFIDQ